MNKTVESMTSNRVSETARDITLQIQSLSQQLEKGTRLSEIQIGCLRKALDLLIEAKEQLTFANPIKIKKVEKKTIPGFSIKKIS